MSFARFMWIACAAASMVGAKLWLVPAAVWFLCDLADRWRE